MAHNLTGHLPSTSPEKDRTMDIATLDDIEDSQIDFDALCDIAIELDVTLDRALREISNRCPNNWPQ
jgi:hypothetical protein